MTADVDGAAVCAEETNVKLIKPAPQNNRKNACFNTGNTLGRMTGRVTSFSHAHFIDANFSKGIAMTEQMFGFIVFDGRERVF